MKIYILTPHSLPDQAIDHFSHDNLEQKGTYDRHEIYFPDAGVLLGVFPEECQVPHHLVFSRLSEFLEVVQLVQ